MDIGRALTYVFDDVDKVKKILIGGLLKFIPIAGWISDGYSLVQTKNISEGRELPLPEWSDFGGFFTKGLMAFLGGLIYSIPGILIGCCMWGAIFFAPGNNPNTGEMGQIATVVMLCGICLVFLYALVLVVLLPALTTRYAITEQFNAFFQLGPAWQMINSNLGGYAMAILAVIIAGFIGGLIGSITCGLGAPFIGFWVSLVGAHVFGNFAKGIPQTS